MSITSLLFGGEIARRVEEQIAEMRDEVRKEFARQQIAESSISENDYAFRMLGYNQGKYDIPEAYVQRVIKESHRLYDTHGLAEVIVDRIVSIILEAGLDYDVQFDEAAADDPDYTYFQNQVRKRLDRWWNDEETDIQEQINDFVTELMLSGEQGFRFDVDKSNGWVRMGDICRDEVKDLAVDGFRKKQLRAVVVRSEDGEEQQLNVLSVQHDKDTPDFGFLSGDCLYYRLRTRPSKRRGKPVLQVAIDELTAEKKFRVLSTDRVIARMSVFLQTTLEGKTDDEVRAYAADTKNNMPASGTRVFTNDKIKNEFVSAKMEAYEIANMVNSMISVIAGMFGFPPSWLGIGDGSNRSIAETQQEPAERNTKNAKTGILGLIERILYFVADRAIVARYVTTDPLKRVNVKGENGEIVNKPLRETMTITVIPVPIAKQKRDAQPFAAVAKALEALTLLVELERGEGRAVLTPEQRAAFLTAAFAADGVGIEVFGDAFESDEPETVPTEGANG